MHDTGVSIQSGKLKSDYAKPSKDIQFKSIDPFFNEKRISIEPEELMTEANQLIEQNALCHEGLSLSKFEHLRITDLTDIPETPPLLKIYGEVVAAYEEITTITGAPKSGKSAFENALIAGSICENSEVIDFFEGVEVLPNSHKKAVIHLDTEQAPRKHQNNLLSILKRAKHTTCPDYYLSYNIRKLGINEYKDVTSGICEAAFVKHKGIHSIWIDGGADYILDVNDPAKAYEVVKFFIDLAQKYQTAVVIIIHTNPGSDKERGHLGSQIQRKTGGTILVKNDGEISTLVLKEMRYGGKDIPQLMFKYDKEKGYHVGCGTKTDTSDPDDKAKKKIEGAWLICKKIFAGQQSYTREKTLDKIMILKACQIRTAAGIFAFMAGAEMISKGPDEHYRINKLYNNDLR